MNNEIINNNDAVEIEGLEYDVGGVGAVESSAIERNEAAFVFSFRLPENQG